MIKATIIGAGGCVGSAAAFHIAASALVDELVLIGRRQNIIEQHVLDLSTAVSALGVRVKAGGYEDLVGSDLVINSAGVHQTVLEEGPDAFAQNVALIQDIMGEIDLHCPQAAVITVTNPIDAMNYAAWRASRGERRRFIGYSLNDSLRFREFVADAKGVAVEQVEATVIGEHGGTQVLLFSSVRIDGLPVTFSEDEKESIRAEVPKFFRKNEALKAGRTAGWTCAVGLAAVTRAVVQDTRQVFPCSAVLEGEYGLQALSVSVPVRLGRGGIVETLTWDLAADERAALEQSVAKLAPAMRMVDGLLGRESR